MKETGSINPHTLSLVMKECSHRAIIEIDAQRISFTSKAKETDYKTEEDLVTSADIAAQEIYLKILNENFPKAGIVAEEDFARKCTDKKHNYYFTIDPLDGTKAFGRGQSTGVGTMISFVFDGKVVAVTIGDINTGEVFHTRFGSEKVHRIYELRRSIQLEINPNRLLRDQYLQLRCDARKLSNFAQMISDPNSDSRLFKEAESGGGSIGITFTRLWKGEVGAILLEPGSGYQTPWDTCPIMGISKKMGFKFFLIAKNVIYEYDFEPAEENFFIGQELLCIHESRVPELEEWCKSIGLSISSGLTALTQSYLNKTQNLGKEFFTNDELFKQWLTSPSKAFKGVAPIAYPYPVIFNALSEKK